MKNTMQLSFVQLSKLLKARNHKASPEHKDISSIFVPDPSKEISSFRELFCLATILNEIQQHCEETKRIYLC